MNYEELFPGRFIKSVDLKGRQVTLTIKSIKGEKINAKLKAIVQFSDTDREWVMNRTNAEALKLMWGPECNDWLGKKVTLYPERIKDPFGEGDITAIRVAGSPEITKAMTAVIQRGMKTIRVAVKPTGKSKVAVKPPPEPEPVPEEFNPDTGEVPFGDA